MQLKTAVYMFIRMKLAYLFAGVAIALIAFPNTANTKFIDAVIAQPLTIRSPLPTTLAQVRPTAKFDSAPNQKLLQTVQDGDIKAVRAALEEGANPNTEKAEDDGNDNYGPTALMLAAEHNYLEIVTLCVSLHQRIFTTIYS